MHGVVNQRFYFPSMPTTGAITGIYFHCPLKGKKQAEISEIVLRFKLDIWVEFTQKPVIHEGLSFL